MSRVMNKMIMTHYVCCSDDNQHWSYRKAKKKLRKVFETSSEQDMLSDIAYILYHSSCKNGKKITELCKEKGFYCEESL